MSTLNTTALAAANLLVSALPEWIEASVWTKKGVRVYLTDTDKGRDMGFAEIVGGEGAKAAALGNVTKHSGSVSMAVGRAFAGLTIEAPAAPESRYVVRYCVECGSALRLDGTCGGCAGS